MLYIYYIDIIPYDMIFYYYIHSYSLIHMYQISCYIMYYILYSINERRSTATVCNSTQISAHLCARPPILLQQRSQAHAHHLEAIRPEATLLRGPGAVLRGRHQRRLAEAHHVRKTLENGSIEDEIDRKLMKIDENG